MKGTGWVTRILSHRKQKDAVSRKGGVRVRKVGNNDGRCSIFICHVIVVLAFNYLLINFNYKKKYSEVVAVERGDFY